MKDKPILVVDDEIDLLTMIRSIFEHSGFTQIITASSGEAALDLLDQKMPAMVILDVNAWAMLLDDGGTVIWNVRLPDNNGKPQAPVLYAENTETVLR